VAFYLPSRPVPYIAGQPALTPQIDDARILRDGMVLVCPMDDFRCKYAEARMRKQFTASRQRGVEVSRTYLGVVDAPVSYSILIVPPLRSQTQ